MKVTAQSRRNLRVNNVLFVILLLVAVGLLAWLSTRYVYQSDWTANGRNTLAVESAAVLDKFAGPISITVFASENDELRRYLKDLMTRYQRLKHDISLSFVNPDLEPQRVRELGITVDGEMLIVYDGQTEQLNDLTERGLSNALQRLLRRGGRKVIFIQGHGERNPRGQASYDLSQWVTQLESKGFEVTTINLAQDVMPVVDDANVYVLASSRSAPLAAELEKIQQLTAGRFLWLVDPGSLKGLDALADQLSLTFNPGMIVDPNISQVGLMLVGTDDPRMTLVTNYGQHRIVEGFAFNTLFPMTQSLTIKRDSDWRATAFLSTMSNVWQETGQVQGQVSFDDGDIAGPLDIGVALSRDDNVQQNADGHPDEARVVVIGDGDFLSNAAIGVGGNLQLAMNIIHWLSGNDPLVNVPVKISSDTELHLSSTVVLVIGAGFLLLIPLALLLSGLGIWWRRRKY